MEQDTSDRIEAYLKNALTESELLIFEKELQENPTLNKAVQEHVFAMAAVDGEEEKSLQKKFAEWDDESKGLKLNTTWLLGIAASIVLFIGSFYLFIKKNESSAQIAQSFYRVPNAPSSSMGTVDAKWVEGLEFFRAKKFDEAVKSWNQIQDANPETLYYLAHSYFNNQDFKKSGSLFQQLSSGTSVFSFPSDWYLALSYLAADNTNSYSIQINLILTDKTHPYYKDAVKLNKKMSSIIDK